MVEHQESGDDPPPPPPAVRTSTSSTPRDSIERLADSVKCARGSRRWKKSINRAFESAELDPQILKGLRECAGEKSIERLEAMVGLELALVEVTSRDVDESSIVNKLQAVSGEDARAERGVQVLTDIIRLTREERPAICNAAMRALAAQPSPSPCHLHEHVENLLIPLLQQTDSSRGRDAAGSAALILRDIALEQREAVGCALPALEYRVANDNEDDELMDACCRCLWNLTYRDQANKRRVRPMIPDLVSIFRRNSRGPAERWSTCEASIGLLANLVDGELSCSENQTFADLLPEIVEAIGGTDAPIPVLEALTRLLGSIVGMRWKKTKSVGLDGDEKRAVVKVLVDVVGDFSKKQRLNISSKTAAAATLQQLALDYECKLEIATVGGVDALAAAFRSKAADDKLKTAVCLALATLCRDSVKNEALVVSENDLVWPVCVFLRKRNDSGQEAASILLGRLALDYNARSQIVLSEAVKPLAGILSHGTEDARHAAATVLWNLALDEEFHEDMISSGTIRPLCVLVDEGTSKARLAAAGALKFLTHVPSVRRTIFDAWDLGERFPAKSSLTESYLDEIIDVRATTTRRLGLSRSLSSWRYEIPDLKEEKTVVPPSRAVISQKRATSGFFTGRLSLGLLRT